MTDPAGGGTPPPSNWGSDTGGGAGTGTQPGFQAAPIAAGPAPGVVYADLVTRVIAYIIDGIILGIAWAIVWSIVAGAILFSAGFSSFLIVGLVLGVLYLAASAAYFVYTWTRMRASVGQRVLGLETVNAADGATLTQDQAIRRWAFLYSPQAIGLVGYYAIGFLGSLLGLLGTIYAIYLLYTASQDPKRQGFHDKQAGTVVVKRVAA
jgi:uncharacterized RDD family membrane protein YckC